MAEKKIYGAFFGPYLYDDADLLSDPDGDFSGMYWNATVTDGLHICAGIRFLDTDQSNHLTMVWNENAAADYILNILVGGGSRSLTLNENLTVGDGFNFTLTALGQANTLTLNEGFIIGDGHSGTLTFSAASKVLTVEDTAIVSQDYSSDSTTVIFAALDLTGMLTIDSAAALILLHDSGTDVGHYIMSSDTTESSGYGEFSIWRCTGAAGGCVLGDNPPLMWADSNLNVSFPKSVTIGYFGGALRLHGNIVMPANGVVGVADGFPSILFDNVNSWLEIAGRVGINKSDPACELHVDGTSPSIQLGKSDGTYTGYRFLSDIAGNDNYMQVGIDNADTTATLSISRFQTGTSEIANFKVFAVENNFSGKVGIGLTTTPVTALHINRAVAGYASLDGGDVSQAAIYIPAAATYPNFQPVLGVGEAGYFTAAISSFDDGGGAAQGWVFHTGNTSAITERMRVTSIGRVGIAVIPLAQLHIDQSSTTAAIPVLKLDQGDVSEQCIKFSSDAVDRDVNLFTVDVTGTPTLMWDESEDAFSLSHVLRGTTSLWWHAYCVDAVSMSPGASAATWLAADANHLAGYQLNAAAEYLYMTTCLHSDWDAASDIEIKVTFEIMAAGGAAGHKERLIAQCYYKGHDGAVATKTQSPFGDVTIDDDAQYTLYVATILIDHDLVDNVVDVGDKMSIRLNLDTANSDVDDILVSHINFRYKTRQMNPEV